MDRAFLTISSRHGPFDLVVALALCACSSQAAIVGGAGGTAGIGATGGAIPPGTSGAGGIFISIPDAASAGGAGGEAGVCGGACSTRPQVVLYCGDGLLDPTKEVCDDGNTTGGDGCTAGCDQVEVGWVCPTPGQPCVNTTRCGDGKISGSETCDVGATGPSAACDANCQLQPGWVCPVPGLPCQAKECGDGILAGNEECDEGANNGNGNCLQDCTLATIY
jgi:cysteine-rich repeat protein